MKEYRVYQTISIFVEAENEVDAREKALSDESNLDGWDRWDVECVNDIPNDIIDFYPPLEEKE